MTCPRCGFDLRGANVAECPRCGQQLADASAYGYGRPAPQSGGWQRREAESSGYGGSGAGWRGGQSGGDRESGDQEYGSPAPGAYRPYDPYDPYGQPAGPSRPMYGQPYGQPAAPSRPMYGQPYGQPAPPSMPGYGQPAGPSRPVYGYPGYGQPAGPSVPMYPPASPWAQPPKRRTGLIVGVVTVVVLVAALIGGGALYLAKSGAGTAGGVPAATTAPTATPVPTVVYENSLLSPTLGWRNDGTHCAFKSDGYHIFGAYECFSPAGDQTDATIEVQVKQAAGPTTGLYGIAFRADTKTGDEYFFGIDSASEWVFGKVANNKGSSISGITSNGAIHAGLNKTNVLEIVSRGSHFVFFVNGTQIGEGDDGTYASGAYGLAGDQVDGQNLDVVFTHLKITK
jgi:hypothetical protein